MAHASQNVHSNEQMRAPSSSGGRSLSQHSQFGLICSMSLSLVAGIERWSRAAARDDRDDECDVGWNDRPGRTRATAATERRLVQELPGLGTIESPNPRRFDERRIKVAEIDSHPVAAPPGRLPVRDATTRCAPTQPKALVTPCVAVDASPASGDLHLAWFIVAPQPSVTATDRAVAAREPSWLSRDLDLNCTAVARPCEHGTSLYVRSDGGGDRRAMTGESGRGTGETARFRRGLPMSPATRRRRPSRRRQPWFSLRT